MEEYKKQANEKFFRAVIETIAEGGVYLYPDAYEKYTIVGGVMYGTKEGVKTIKAITPRSFHNNIKEQASE